jgi:competence protein ComEC
VSGKVPPAVSLIVSYAGGYALAGGVGVRWEAATAIALAAASLCAVAALCVAPRAGAARKARGLSVAAAVTCFAFCGFARGVWEARAAEAAVDGLRAYDAGATGAAGEPRALTLAVGKVVSFPRELEDGTRFVLELRAAACGACRDVWEGDAPRLLVTVRPASDVRYGDLLKIAGRLSLPRGPRNPGGFDDRSYLLSMRAHARLSARATTVRLIDQGRGFSAYCRILCPIRRGLGALIGRRLEGEPLALVRGLLLGDRSLMERDLRESLARAGVIHIMAVSGLHAGLVALIVLGAARCAGVGGAAAEVLSAAGVWLYCALVGFPASACRAATMIAAFVLCRRLQRPSSPFTPLAAAALALTLARPRWIMTAGFQLSFSAAAGVIGFSGLLGGARGPAALSRVPGAGYAASLLGASLGAGAATWPIVAYHFGRAPILFLLGNAVAVPLVGLVLAWGLAGAALGSVSTALSDWLLAACWAASRLLLSACRAVAAVPWSSATVVAFSPWLVAGYLVALVASFSPRRRVRATAVACVLLSSALICAGVPRRTARGRLEASFLDVGHGDACVMIAPGGETMLVDAGPATAGWNAGRDVILPFLRSRGVRHLDRVVISHGDGDHWGGLDEISRGVAVKEIVLPRGVPLGALADLLPALRGRGASVVRAAAGDTLRPLGALECTVLHPSAEFEGRWAGEMGEGLNERSLVLRVRYGECVLLATGDIERRAESWLAAHGAPLKCTVMKVPHHGSDTSSCAAFAAMASPLVAVISCGPPERFNLPKPTVTARYDSLGAAWMLTARDGAVVALTDGTSLWVTPTLAPEAALHLDLSGSR